MTRSIGRKRISRTEHHNNKSLGTTTDAALVPTDQLLGDGKAKVGISIPLMLAGGDYNKYKIGVTVSVELSCNQDNKSISAAYDTAIAIVSTVMRQERIRAQQRLAKLEIGK